MTNTIENNMPATTSTRPAGAPIVIDGQDAFITGTRGLRGDVVRGVDITPLFTFGSIYGVVEADGGTYDDLYEMIHRAANRINGNEEFWANLNSTAILGAGYEQARADENSRRGRALRLAVGDQIIFRNIRLMICTAPNNNVRLVRVGEPVGVGSKPAQTTIAGPWPEGMF